MLGPLVVGYPRRPVSLAALSELTSLRHLTLEGKFKDFEALSVVDPRIL